MANKDKSGFKANYNGEAIKLGEVMIPFEFTEPDAENCTNPECIKIVRQGGKCFKVIYKAVPKEWAKTGKSALNLIQNEMLGHYTVPNSVSMDALKEEYDLELDKVLSAEDVMMEELDREELFNTFTELIHTLIEKSPKIGYAVLLLHTGIKGESFYEKMNLTHSPANLVRQQAEKILQGGLANFDINDIKSYKSKYDDLYREKAYEVLDKIIKMYY